MRRAHLLCGACAALLLLPGCDRNKPAAERSPAGASTLSGAELPRTGSDVERGKYLVAVGNCNDCHTPKKMGPNGPEPDPSRLLEGHPADEKVAPPPTLGSGWVAATTSSFTAWAGPWGISYAANLTPDAETGLGGWTQEQFTQALRTGKHLGAPGARPILPPMPWFDYATMSDADLRALFAYLRSIPPRKNAVPAPVNEKSPM